MTSIFFSFLISVLISGGILTAMVWIMDNISYPIEPKFYYLPLPTIFPNIWETDEDYAKRKKEVLEIRKEEYQKEREEYENEYEEYQNEVKWCNKAIAKQHIIQAIVVICVFILVFAISYLGISYYLSMSSKEEIAEYQAQKVTIEQSLSNEELSGLERIELVKQASELNGWLAKQKVIMSKWTEFDIYKSVREEYQRAEYIDLGVE